MVTISREAGVRGEEIARALAEKLKWKFLDREALEQLLTERGFSRTGAFLQDAVRIPGCAEKNALNARSDSDPSSKKREGRGTDPCFPNPVFPPDPAGRRNGWIPPKNS